MKFYTSKPVFFLLLLLLLVPFIVANPILAYLEEFNTTLQQQSACRDAGECRNPYSCIWKGGIVSCVKIDRTGEIVDSSTGIVIAYVDDTSTLANGTILVNDSVILSPQHQPQKHHDYVLNCGDNSGPRYKKCSGSPYKYYCRKDGFLWNKAKDDPDCIDNCDCQKVHIKYCPLSNSKSVPCVASPVSDVANPTTALLNGSSANSNAIDIPSKREATEARQPEIDLMAAEVAVVGRAALAKRHNYALDCSSASLSTQKECKEFGYYCDSAGKVQAQYGRFVSCDIECECRTLANCLVTRWDVVCLKGKLVANDETPGTVTAQVINGTSVLLNDGTVVNDVKWE